MLKWRKMQWSFTATASIPGIGSSEPVLGDFPAAVRGAPAIQGIKWRLSSGAPPTVPARRRGRDPEEVIYNFALFLGLYVRLEF
jgi:hypothetical protein